jgi:hypothetical protein
MSAKTVKTTTYGLKSRFRASLVAGGLPLMALGLALLSHQAQADDLKGFGTAIPLNFAVQQILPPGYTATFAPSTNPSETVSWTGDAPWQTVLSNLFSANHLHGTFNGTSLIVAGDVQIGGSAPTIDGPGLSIGGPATPASYDTSQPVLQGAPPIESGAAAVPASDPDAAYVPPPGSPGYVSMPVVNPSRSILPMAVKAMPAVNPPVVDGMIAPDNSANDVWQIKAGEDLNQVLGTWAHKAGWTLAYNTDIVYPMQANAQINGDFVSAVSELIKAIHADPRPYATFYKANQALVVSDANHISQSQGQ